MDDKPKKMQTGKLMQRSEKSIKYEMLEKLNDVKEMIDRHTNKIHSTVTDGAKRTIAFVQALQEKNNDSDAQKRNKNGKKTIKLNSALSSLLRVWNELKPKNNAPDVSVSFEFSESDEKDGDDQKSTNAKNEPKHTVSRSPTSIRIPLALLICRFIDFQLTGIDTKIDRLRRQDVLSAAPIRKV